MPRTKWYKNLENKNMNRWHESMRKKSKARADVYLRLVSSFSEYYAKMTPWEFASLPKRKMEDITMDYVTFMESHDCPLTKRPYAPKYIGKFVDAISSWARWNSKRFERQISVTNPNSSPTAENERIPTPEELRKVLFAPTTSLRARVVIALIAFSGACFITYGDYEGMDGLKIKDLPELKIRTDENGKQKEVTFEKVPAFVVVRSNLSKSRLEYRTQLAEEGVEILKEWLDKRIRSGEVLGPESGIIVTTEDDRKRLDIPLGTDVKDATPFMCSGRVSDLVRRAMRASGLPWRTYIFRSYFDSALATGEQKGWVTHSFQQFFMGHVGDIETVYTTRKHQLPEPMVEEMREAYRRCQALLQTRLPRSDVVTTERAKEIGKLSWLQGIGFTDDEIKGQQLLTKEGPELSEIVRKKLLSNVEKQRFVKPSEIDLAAAEGYVWKGNLPDGRVVMELGV